MPADAVAAPARHDVPPEERWNAESVFPTPEAWDDAFRELAGRLGELEPFRGRLGEAPSVLADFFALRDDLLAAFGRLRVYATMSASVDSADRAAQARQSRAGALGARLGAALAFAEPELLALGIDRVRELAAAEARLEHLGPYLERLERRAPHTRSGEVEELLSELAAPFGGAGRAHGTLANRDLPFEDAIDADGGAHTIAQSTIDSLLHSNDRTLRESAWRRYADAHRDFAPTMAQLLETGVRQTNLLADARRYDDALQMALAPLAIPRGVVETLLDTFRAKLPIWHRYFRAKGRLLGVDRFRPWDVKARMGDTAPVVPFELAVDELAEATAPLGDDYVEILRRGSLEERWVDRSPNKGKRMGAFSTGSPGTHSFIMMSYTPDVFGMSTLAHELGHSLHSHLSFRNQPFLYHRYTLFHAEVASNFNQAILRSHLFEKTAGDADWELALIEEAMANFYRYFLVMPTLERLEIELHERAAAGEALTDELMTERTAALFAEAYGDAMTLEGDDRERLGVTWAQFHTHLYSRFYVYQYATGIAAANALAEEVRDGRGDAVARYREFLASGGRRDPLDALRRAGVDLETAEPVERGFAVLEGLVERLERLADERS